MLAQSLDHVGPMTRYVRDAAAMFEVIAGAGPSDPTSLQEPVPAVLDALTGEVRGLRVGWDESYATRDIDPGLVSSVTAALGVLESLGVEVVDVTMPGFTPEHFNLWIGIAAYEASQAHAATFPARADEYGAFMRAFLEAGQAVSEEAYLALMAQREDFSSRFRDALSSVDAVLCPPGHVPSPAADEVGYGGLDAIATAEENPNFRFTFPADFAGTPSLTLPCGATASGAPYGLQLMGSRLSEPTLCRLGHAYEQATEWHSRHPAV